MLTPKKYLAFVWLLHLQSSLAYQWPSPQYDALETFLYQGQRSDGSNLASLVHPCRKRTGTMASVAAEWLRFVCFVNPISKSSFTYLLSWQAFHDMATHDIDSGSGGLDGSLVYELDRSAVCLYALNLSPNSDIYVNRILVLALIKLSQTLKHFQTNTFLVSKLFLPVQVVNHNCRGGYHRSRRCFRSRNLRRAHRSIPWWACRRMGSRRIWNTWTSARFRYPQRELPKAGIFGYRDDHLDGLWSHGWGRSGCRFSDACICEYYPRPAPHHRFRYDDTVWQQSVSQYLAPCVRQRFWRANRVTEYLDGTTQNVLVITPNTTMASDIRVFMSDGNQTMRR